LDSKKFFTIAGLTALSALTACNGGGGGGSLSDAVGHFEGFEVNDNGLTSTQVSVSADVTSNSDSSLSVVIQTEPATKETDLNVSVDDNSNLIITSSSGLFDGSITLTQGQNDCYDSAQQDELCVSGAEIRLAVVSSKIKFVFDKMPARALPQMETPAPFTIDALVQRSMNQSFTSQASFESVVQAKLTAKQAEMNLLPHINIGSALNIESLSLLTMVRSIGDLVPFFLPNHWFEAASDQDQSRAQVDAYKVVQAGAMNIVRGLALSVLRDEESLRKLSDDEVQIMQIRDEVVAAEQDGGIPLGHEATINVVIAKIDNTVLALNEAISEEKGALSQAAGFNNPLAVSEVEPVTALPISAPISQTLASLQAEATSRSLQLIQADELIAAAKENKNASKFQWLDPAGDDNGSLGFGYVDHIEIQQAQVDQLLVNRATTQSQILLQVQDLLSQSSTLYSSYQNDVLTTQQSQESVELYLQQFEDGVAFDMSLLASVLGQKANSDVAEIQDIYANLALLAQLDFLTFSGPYAPLIGETP
jgi:outer membrane protein TolC